MAEEEPFTIEKLKGEIASGKRKKATSTADTEEEAEVEWEDDDKDKEGKEEGDDESEEEPKEGKAKRAGKAVGRGIKSGAGAAGKWLTGTSESTGEWKKKYLPWLIPILGGGGLWTFGFATFAIILVSVFAAVMLLKWLHGKYPRIFKIIVIPTALILVYLGYTALTGTGMFYMVKEKVNIDVEGDAMETSMFAGVKEWWHCNVVAPGTCLEEVKLSEEGGVYIRSVAPTMETYREGDEIEISGNLEGVTWSAGWGAEGPDLNDVDVTVDVQWEDKDYLRTPWTCQQPEGPNSDFTCWYAGVDGAGLVKNPRAEMCGVKFHKLKKAAAGTMYCKADVNINYGFNSSAFRKLIFTDDPKNVDWSLYSKKDIMFSTGGPVGFTIGSNRDWNEAIRPYAGHKKTLPISIYSDTGLTDTTTIRPTHAVLTIKQRPGLTVESEDCELASDNALKVWTCTKTDFKSEELDIESGPIEFKLTLTFDESFLEGKDKQTLDIIGQLDYDVTTTKTTTVNVKYNMKETDIADAAPATIDEHYCGLGKTGPACVEGVLKKSGEETEYCQNPVCKIIEAEAGHSKRVHCTCDITGSDSLDVYCCNSWKCELAKSAQTNLPQINAACDDFTMTT